MFELGSISAVGKHNVDEVQFMWCVEIYLVSKMLERNKLFSMMHNIILDFFFVKQIVHYSSRFFFFFLVIMIDVSQIYGPEI